MNRERFQVLIELQHREGSATNGELTIVTHTRPEQTKRALWWWGGLWGVAILSLPFPLLHFILPPTMLLAGPIVAFVIYHQQSYVVGGSGRCPHCGSEIRISRASADWPLKDMCEKCLEHVHIKLQK
jgi:hypothetical protein